MLAEVCAVNFTTPYSLAVPKRLVLVFHNLRKSCVELLALHQFYTTSELLLVSTILWLRNQGANYKKILRLSYDVIITYDNRKSNLR